MRRVGEEISSTKHMLKQYKMDEIRGKAKKKISCSGSGSCDFFLLLKHIMSPNLRELIIHRKFMPFF